LDPLLIRDLVGGGVTEYHAYCNHAD
jgi:hypothetical protein